MKGATAVAKLLEEGGKNEERRPKSKAICCKFICMQPSVPGRDTGGFKVFMDKTVPMRCSVTLTC